MILKTTDTHNNATTVHHWLGVYNYVALFVGIPMRRALQQQPHDLMWLYDVCVQHANYSHSGIWTSKYLLPKGLNIVRHATKPCWLNLIKQFIHRTIGIQIQLGVTHMGGVICSCHDKFIKSLFSLFALQYSDIENLNGKSYSSSTTFSPIHI